MVKTPDYHLPKVTETLGYLASDWLARHAVVPDGELQGQPFEPTVDHVVFLLNHYAVAPSAKPGDRAAAFKYRRSAWVAAQKVGKSPGIAGHALIEFVGPALFAGYADGSQSYKCADFGCPCGWERPYAVGEPMGKPWPSPRIQLAAVVEDQVANTWDALVDMVNNGPLANVLPKIGYGYARHPSGGKNAVIETVTSKADSKLGARITAAFPDETGLYTDQNGMRKFNNTLLRGLGGMSGRMAESSNPPDPTENSWLQTTMEAGHKDVYVHYFPPPADLNFAKKTDRQKIFEFNYQFSPWVDLRSIEATASELMVTNPGEAERFYGNRIVAGNTSWIKAGEWEARRSPALVKPRTPVCLGFDGSVTNDWTGIRAETFDFYQFTPTYHNGDRETTWNPQEWGGKIPRLEVSAAFEEIMSEFDVRRVYVDPFGWGTELDEWSAKYGKEIFVEWRTNRTGLMWEELERFRMDVLKPDTTFTHDGNDTAAIHIRNAVEKAIGAFGRYYIEKPTEHQKIDLAMSSVLAHSAVCDALADGAGQVVDSMIFTGTSTSASYYGKR